MEIFHYRRVSGKLIAAQMPKQQEERDSEGEGAEELLRKAVKGRHGQETRR